MEIEAIRQLRFIHVNRVLLKGITVEIGVNFIVHWDLIQPIPSFSIKKMIKMIINQFCKGKLIPVIVLLEAIPCATNLPNNLCQFILDKKPNEFIVVIYLYL